MNKPFVSISCLTYNHVNYIKDAIDGFLMQKTDFDFEILIHDDASTDGTTKIIKEYEKKYPNIIKPLYEEENQWQKGRRGSAVFNFPRAQGKYIALCEGDDYWTDPYKLQKQVDFLEKNSDYGLVHSQIEKLNDATQEKILITKDRSKTSFIDLLNENPIATLTTCIDKELLFRYIDEVQPQTRDWIAGDTPMWLWFSIHSKIFFIDETTATYRVRLGSLSNVKSSEKYIEYIQSRLRIREFFIFKYFNSNKDYLSKIYSNYYKDAEFHALKIKDFNLILDISKWKKKKKLFFSAVYLHLMFYLKKWQIIYILFFNLYRIHHKIVFRLRKLL